MEEDLRAVLLADATVTGLVIDRVDWGSRRQGAPLPAMVLYVVSGAEGYTLKGADGLSITRVQIDCYGDTYASAKTLSRAVISALGGYSDTDFPGVFHVGTRDDREGGSNEADRPFRTSLDFNVNWRG
jgi:hypothetical protein